MPKIRLGASTKRLFCEFLKTAVRVCGIVAIVFFILLVGPIAEGKFFPVIGEIHDVLVVPEGDGLSLTFHGTKLRSCRFDQLEILEKKSNGEFVGTYADDSSKLPRALGTQQFGPWHIDGKGSALIVSVTHHCHPLWDTVTSLIHWPPTK